MLAHAHELTLGLSFLLGALHALEPGHGKTAMMVYLAGGGRSVWHPVLMGLSTALAHSVSLMAIAFAVHLSHHALTGDHHHEESVSTGLQWISAALVLGVGGFLLVQAYRGRNVSCSCAHHRAAAVSAIQTANDQTVTDHHAACCHRQTPCVPEGEPTTPLVALDAGAPADRSEHANPDLARSDSPRASSLRTTALLGLAVGLLPCPSALAAYFTGLSAGTPGTAYLIVALFAAGIACSLTAVGIALQRLGDRVGQTASRWADWPWMKIRAGLILGLGVFYLARLAWAEWV